MDAFECRGKEEEPGRKAWQAGMGSIRSGNSGYSTHRAERKGSMEKKKIERKEADENADE